GSRQPPPAPHPAPVPKTQRQPPQPVRATGPAGAEAVAGHSLPVRSMEDGGRQHRLSHRSGAALLQRAVRAGASGGRGTPDGGDSGSPPSRGAGGFPRPLLRAGKSNYANRAHAQGAPEVYGADAFGAD